MQLEHLFAQVLPVPFHGREQRPIADFKIQCSLQLKPVVDLKLQEIYEQISKNPK